MNFWNKIFLTKEIKKWEEKKIIDSSTACKIASLYNIDLQETRDKNSFVLQLVAYLFISLALFTFVGANWEDIPRFIRLVIVLGITVGINMLGYYFLRKERENMAIGIFFLGNTCYGASIALIAQIYHLGEHMPNGILLWATGAMVMSLVVGRSVLVAQSLVIASSWFIVELMEYDEVMYGLIIFLLISGYILWRESSKFLALVLYIMFYVYIVSIAKYFYEGYYWLERVDYIPFVSLGYSLLGMSISHFYTIEKKEIGTYIRNYSFILGCLSLIILLFYNSFEVKNPIFGFYQETYLGVLCGILLILSVLINLYKRNYFLLGFCVFILFVPILMEFCNSPKFVFSILNTIVGGVLIKKNKLSLGLGMIFLVAIVRYIELIGDYIGASLLFLIFAIIILIINYKRKQNEK